MQQDPNLIVSRRLSTDTFVPVMDNFSRNHHSPQKKKKKKKGSITASVLRSLRSFSLLSFARLLFLFFFSFHDRSRNHLQHLPPPPAHPVLAAHFLVPCFFSEGGGERLTRFPLGACLPFFFPPPAPFISLPFASTALGYRARIYRYPIGIHGPRIPVEESGGWLVEGVRVVQAPCMALG